jgi:hypothetical protein
MKLLVICDKQNLEKTITLYMQLYYLQPSMPRKEYL